MSISSEITRINSNIADAYDAISGKGGTLPTARNSANLPAAIASIPSGGGKGGDYNIIQTVDGDNCSLAITDANTFTVIPKTVTANGTYNASDDNADGYSQVTVAIPTYDGTVV